MTGKFAVFAVKAFGTYATVTGLITAAHTSILAWTPCAIVHLYFTMSPHVTGFAVAVVVVDELDAVQSSGIRARVGQAFVDVSFAP